MLTVPQIKQIVTNIGKKYGIKSAYLFGSYAKNTANEDSDIDLIVDKGRVKTYREYSHMWDELESKLGKKVDLLSTKGVTSDFYDRIKNDRMLIYGRPIFLHHANWRVRQQIIPRVHKKPFRHQLA